MSVAVSRAQSSSGGASERERVWSLNSLAPASVESARSLARSGRACAYLAGLEVNDLSVDASNERVSMPRGANDSTRVEGAASETTARRETHRIVDCGGRAGGQTGSREHALPACVGSLTVSNAGSHKRGARGRRARRVAPRTRAPLQPPLHHSPLQGSKRHGEEGNHYRLPTGQRNNGLTQKRQYRGARESEGYMIWGSNSSRGEGKLCMRVARSGFTVVAVYSLGSNRCKETKAWSARTMDGNAGRFTDRNLLVEKSRSG